MLGLEVQPTSIAEVPRDADAVAVDVVLAEAGENCRSFSPYSTFAEKLLVILTCR
jgi:hypothetical protein